MKLEELFEVNFQSVDIREPSGVSSPTPVDPDKIREMDRAKRIRRQWKTRKNLRGPAKTNMTVKGDNEDLTGSGAHSVVNGPYNY